jgi:hypothetical protein
MNAQNIKVYTAKLGPHDEHTIDVRLGAKPSADYWDGRVILRDPMVTMDGKLYQSIHEMRPSQARALARQLSRAANLIDPPKKKAT